MISDLASQRTSDWHRALRIDKETPRVREGRETDVDIYLESGSGLFIRFILFPSFLHIHIRESREALLPTQDPVSEIIMPHATDTDTDTGYEYIQLKPLAPTFAAEVTGVDFSLPVEKEVFQEIHRAIVDVCSLYWRKVLRIMQLVMMTSDLLIVWCARFPARLT